MQTAIYSFYKIHIFRPRFLSYMLLTDQLVETFHCNCVVIQRLPRRLLPVYSTPLRVVSPTSRCIGIHNPALIAIAVVMVKNDRGDQQVSVKEFLIDTKKADGFKHVRKSLTSILLVLLFQSHNNT